MPYVNQRWLGGLLTNFQTISKRIKRLHDLNEWVEDGTMELLPTRERIAAMKEREKLDINLGGVRNMQRPPDAIFVVDLKTEAIAVREAERLGIPIIGLVDTNVDPDPTSFPIPGNDDAIRSCKVIIDAIGDVAAERATGVPRRGGGRPPRARGEGAAARPRSGGAQGGRGAGAQGGGGGEARRGAGPRGRATADAGPAAGGEPGTGSRRAEAAVTRRPSRPSERSEPARRRAE